LAHAKLRLAGTGSNGGLARVDDLMGPCAHCGWALAPNFAGSLNPSCALPRQRARGADLAKLARLLPEVGRVARDPHPSPLATRAIDVKNRVYDFTTAIELPALVEHLLRPRSRFGNQVRDLQPLRVSQICGVRSSRPITHARMARWSPGSVPSFLLYTLSGRPDAATERHAIQARRGSKVGLLLVSCARSQQAREQAQLNAGSRDEQQPRAGGNCMFGAGRARPNKQRSRVSSRKWPAGSEQLLRESNSSRACLARSLRDPGAK
jgi:hypothetical protein